MEQLFAAPIGALIIFGLRLIDVSLAVLRMILAVRGRRGLAALIGFAEVLVWLIAAGQALKHLDSLPHVIGYAGGFAAGNYVGVWLEGRLAIGMNVVHAVVRRVPSLITEPDVAIALRDAGYAVTEMTGRGYDGDVQLLMIVARRRDVPAIVGLIREQVPDVFVSIEDVRDVQGGFMQTGGRKFPILLRT